MRTSSDSYLLILLLVAVLVCPPPLLAAVIVVDGSCTLVDAITAANTDTVTGGCPAGSGADEIELTVDVTLTAVDNTTDGPNGLPSVTSEMTIRSSDDSPRTIERGGGAPEFRIFHTGSGGTLSLDRLFVSNGDPGSSSGGGIFNLAQLTLTDSTVAGNTASWAGAINNYYGTVTLTNSTVSGNSANFNGGGIHNSGTATLTNATVSGNSTTFGGGGMLNYGGTATLTNSTVSGNSANNGGGILNTYGTVTLINSTVSGNSVNHNGGGIYNSYYAHATLTNSTVSGNSANNGGGISIYDATLTLTNSTVSGNSASLYGGGIGTYYGTVTLSHSTVSGNSASYGGGIDNYDATVTLTGSLVGNSPSGGNCDGFPPVTDGGDNLADDATCGTIPDTLTGLDPVLTDNGGPTLTHALLLGSNAIDLAGDCGLATDQRLFLRDDGSCDSGSFEFGAVPSDPTAYTTLFAWDTLGENLWSIDTAPPPTSTFIGSGGEASIIAEIEFGNDVIYGADTAENTDFRTIDPATGQIVSTMTLTFPPEGDVLTSLELVDGTMYAGLTTEGGGPTFLSTVDLASGVVSVVGATGVGSPFGGLAYDISSGTMYAVSAGGSTAELFTIDLASGAASSVGLVTVGGQTIQATALEFGNDGVLYAAPSQGDARVGHLLTVDPVTAVATDFGHTGIGGLVALTSGNLLFSDGFESGDTSAWSSTVP